MFENDPRSIWQVLKELIRRSFDFQGRSRRSDGWLWLAAELLIALLTGKLLYERALTSEVAFHSYEAIHIVILIPVIGWTIRRLHDIEVGGL